MGASTSRTSTRSASCEPPTASVANNIRLTNIRTHIITTSLTPAKVREFQHMKVVTPAWLTDSVKRGTLHNWREYIFVPGGQRESTQGRRSNQTSLFAHRQAQAPPSSMRSKLFGQNADLTTSPPFPSNASLSKSLLTSRHDSQDEFDVPPPPNPLQPKSRYPTSSPSSPPPLHKASSIPSNTDMLNKDPTSPATCVSVETASKDAESTSPLQPVRVPNYAAHKSNPDAQRVMADANWRAAHTSAAPDFIEGYYKNSRLHHLSAWKAELRALVQEAQEREESGNTLEDVPLDEATKFVGARPLDLASSKGKCKQKSTSHTDRVIMHCDFDSV
jgi:DNA repair protein REV1